MATDALKRVVTLTGRLEAKPALYPDRSPHPQARKLTLPDGATAPDVLRAWAGFDERYPWGQTSKRSGQSIASADGVIPAKAMSELVAEVGANADAELRGHGVLLEPAEPPERLLWIRPEGEGDPMVLWHEDKTFARRQPFDEWLVSLFAEPAS